MPFADVGNDAVNSESNWWRGGGCLEHDWTLFNQKTGNVPRLGRGGGYNCLFYPNVRTFKMVPTQQNFTKNRQIRRVKVRRRTLLMLLGAAAVLAVVIVGVVAQQPVEESTSAPAEQSGEKSGEQTLDLARRVDGEVTALGEVDAPVVLVEYADFRCPFCGVFARDTLPVLVEEYVDSGQVRIEWRDLPVFGQESTAAAVAARAAGEQGFFWEFAEVVFAGAPERGHVALPPERLLEIATEIGVPNLEQFVSDLDNAELLEKVNIDAAEARYLGITSTPMFVVNETPISGAMPVQVFRDTIDSELAKAGR
ncbi:Protein-disulfide isomerase [Cryobacterium flavum]|uniref:Protein-disulfide isomerase n=2 Tax=Cryobacterium flavum TaxID=1424659 RepID=A0A5E9FU31_9MICO|nr:DsbA family protein [Cryobacterium flavum]SDM60883.1 Protein-disulfide isomerase [Cryobacterium flavum]